MGASRSVGSPGCHVLREAGVDFYCWDIEDPADAEHAIAQGAAGVIADDLDLLRGLAGRPVRTETA